MDPLVQRAAIASRLRRATARLEAGTPAGRSRSSRGLPLPARYSLAIDTMTQGLCLYDADDRLELVNARFCELYNQKMEALRPGTRFRDILANSIAIGNYPGRTVEEVYRERKAFIDRRQPGTFLQELGDGRLIAISHQPMPDGGWVATYEDITERRRTEARIRFLAQHDSLTLLPNRVLFGEWLAELVAAARPPRPCALLCMDLDKFKSVNDTLGHAAGDALLRQVADRLRLELRSGDLAARLGGDEFAMLLPATDAPGALAVSRRVIGALARGYEIAGCPASIGVSIGIACAPDHAGTPDALLSRADAMLYAVKRDGAGRAMIYEPGVESLKTRRPMDVGSPTQESNFLQEPTTLVGDLAVALESGRLYLHYQPILGCADHALVAFEALLRWDDPVRGKVPPAEFVPVAEENGLIGALTSWALSEACAEAARWEGDIAVYVNVSPRNLQQPDFAKLVAATLAETGLPPHRLTIEITEGIMLERSERVFGTIEALRTLGVSLCLDDFGTGHANLAALRDLPLGLLKIDRMFLDGTDTRREPVLGAMIAMGHACGLTVVAEGVETAEQIVLLQRLGCDRMQGFLLGRPAPATALAGVVRR